MAITAKYSPQRCISHSPTASTSSISAYPASAIAIHCSVDDDKAKAWVIW